MSAFLDSNILLYACMEQDAEKMRIAVDLLRQSDCHISVQSLNEMTNTLRRKTKLSLDDIGELVSDIRSLTTVHDLTTSVYARGWAIVRRYGLQTYDSLILACAIENGHETVLSEDMQNGLSLFGMTIIRNPFEGIYKYSEVS